MQAPCRECPARKENCHASCERYARYKTEREQFAQKKRTEQIRGSDIWPTRKTLPRKKH